MTDSREPPPGAIPDGWSLLGGTFHTMAGGVLQRWPPGVPVALLCWRSDAERLLFVVRASEHAPLRLLQHLVMRDSTVDFDDTLCRPARRWLRLRTHGLTGASATALLRLAGLGATSESQVVDLEEEALLAVEARIPGWHP